MPSPMRFSIVARVLVQHGWVLVRITGSHHHFAKHGEPRLLTVPVHHGQVKYGYITKIRKEFGIDIGKTQ